jgi:hypothetical protein
MILKGAASPGNVRKILYVIQPRRRRFVDTVLYRDQQRDDKAVGLVARRG